jgi:hypothetical protein
MAKIQLGKTPTHFKKKVPIVLVTGAVAEIEFNFVYRTRKQFAELIDEKLAQDLEYAAQADRDAAAAEALARTDQENTVVRRAVADWYAEADKSAAQFVLKIANGWDLDDPFTEETLVQLQNEHPGALEAVTAIYRGAVGEARVKN